MDETVKMPSTEGKDTKAQTVFNKVAEALNGVETATMRAQKIHNKLYGTPIEEKDTAGTVTPNNFFDRIFADLNDLNKQLHHLNIKLVEIDENL